MAEWLHDVFRHTHAWVGIAALMLFWVPALTRKGGRVHRTAGRSYVYFMLVVTITGILLSLRFLLEGRIVAGVFLGYLGVITFTAVWTGWRVLSAKRSANDYITPTYRALAWLNLAAGLVVLGLGLIQQVWLFLLFSPIGILAGIGSIRFMRNPPTDRWYWLYEHFGGMIGSGIAAHIAFLAFGSRQMFPDWPLNGLGVLPWITPLVVGVAATVLLNRHYRRKSNPLVRPGAELTRQS